MLLKKLPAPEFTVTTKLECNNLAVGEKTGLIIMGIDYSFLAVERNPSGYRLLKSSCKNAREGTLEIEEDNVSHNNNSLLLRVSVKPGAICDFSYSTDGKNFTALGKTFKAREGRWIGAKVGLFCLAKNKNEKPGYADFHWFRFN